MWLHNLNYSNHCTPSAEAEKTVPMMLEGIIEPKHREASKQASLPAKLRGEESNSRHDDDDGLYLK